MVAERVDVSTRRAGDAEGWKWTSDGRGAFTIAEDKDAPARGTRITLHLREGEEEYLDATRLRQIVHTYSDHIAVPVVLESKKEDEPDETLNAARSEEHTSELQSLMRISYAVFCLKKKNKKCNYYYRNTSMTYRST